MSEEKVGLRSTRRRSRLGKVIAASNEAGLGGAGVVLAELGVAVSCSLSRLRRL